MKFDYSKTINEQLPTFDYYKNKYISYELELMNNRKEIERLNNIITELEKYIENEYLAYRPEDIQHYYGKDILDKLQELKGSDK